MWCPAWVSFTQAMVRGAPYRGPGNFPLARVWGFVPGWQQRSDLQTSTPSPQVIVVSPGQEGEEGAGAGYKASSKELTSGHSSAGGLPFNKVCLFPPRALGTYAKTEWLTGSQALPPSGRQSARALLPEQQESSLYLALWWCGLYRVSLWELQPREGSRWGR